MTKVAFAAAFSAFLLAACGSREGEAGANGAAVAAAKALDTKSAADPAPPIAPTNEIADPVPPPDAVSHPNGYLPLGPGEAEPTAENPPSSEGSPPATEDEYLRNRQAGR